VCGDGAKGNGFLIVRNTKEQRYKRLGLVAGFPHQALFSFSKEVISLLFSF